MDKAAQELKDNPYLKRFRELIDQLMVQKGSLFVFDIEIKNVCKKIDDKGMYGYSVNFHISDRSLDSRKLYPVCRFDVVGKEVADNLRDIDSELCGFIFLRAYEAHRKYLYDITKLFLFHNPDMIEIMIKKKKRDYIFGKMGNDRYDIDNNNEDCWNVFVDKLEREDVRKALVNAYPELKKWEENMFSIDNPKKRNDVDRWNKYYSDWNDWYEVATGARNAITHNNFVIKSEKAEKWKKNGKWKYIFTEKYGKESMGEYKVKLDQKIADVLIRDFGEHAFLVFKAVSIKNGCIWDILPLRGNWDQ